MDTVTDILDTIDETCDCDNHRYLRKRLQDREFSAAWERLQVYGPPRSPRAEAGRRTRLRRMRHLYRQRRRKW